ncbi:MAG: YraN family protein [Cryobacterium sp.]|nr:YraN family protein [Cryobacterium sp.]
MAAKDELGRYGEELAARYLTGLGYTIIERNWHTTGGELDIVARDRDTTVFVEVKTRRSTGFGHPFEAITEQKLARLRRLAMMWMTERGVARGAGRDRIRIDAVAILAPREGAPSIEHLKAIG